MTKSTAKRTLDNWRFWMGVAYFGLVGVTVALWVNYTRLSQDETRAAKAAAILTANAEAQYAACVKSIPELTKVNTFVHGVQDEHVTLLQNAIASHAVQPRNTPLWHIQVGNIYRLRRANDEVKGLRFPVPTFAQCRKLRAHLLTVARARRAKARGG